MSDEGRTARVDADWITQVAEWLAIDADVSVDELPFSEALPWGGPRRPWDNGEAWELIDVDRERFLADLTARYGPNP